MKLGLCLSGGGSRGIYQIGATMALKEAGIFEKIDVFSGTSIGAANVAIIVSRSVEEAKDVWFNLDEKVLRCAESTFSRIKKEKIKFIDNGVYNICSLEQVLKKRINLNKLRKKEVYITISRAGEEEGGILSLLKSSYAHYIKKNAMVIYSPIHKEKEDNIYKQVIASCSIPVVFPPTIINGKKYYDGGIYDNVPVKPLVDAGCDKIIVIHLDRLPHIYRYKYPNVNFYSLSPKHSLGWPLKFCKDKIKLKYQLGYQDMKAYIEKGNLDDILSDS